MKPTPYVTLMLVPDGTEARRGLRMRAWLLKALVAAVACVLIGIVVFFFFYGRVLQRAAMTEDLLEENERLRRYQYKVLLLEENLRQSREMVGRLTELAGVDYVMPELPDDSTLFASLGEPIGAILNRHAEPDMHFPSGLPLQGFITQDFEVEDQDRYHPGVDVACAVGTPILATAAGEVVHIGYDSTYGDLLAIRHSDTVTTLYGHLSEVLVEEGQHVTAGARVALSGNTGVSTAPHLHYEIRINNEPINPLKD